MAVSDSVLAADQSVTQVATPDPLRDSAPQPVIVVPASSKFMVPVGVTPGPEIVAVRVVLVPTVVGEGETVRTVVLVAAPTDSEISSVEEE
jgi:hypothetical protein